MDLALRFPWKSGAKTVSVFLTAVILWVIYSGMDAHSLIAILARARWDFLAWALVLFIPQVLAASLRWRILVRGMRLLSLWEAARLLLAGKALNALAPSKLGELSKAFFLSRDAGVDPMEATVLCIQEKVFNLVGLGAVILLGLGLTPERSSLLWTGGLAAGCMICGCMAWVFFPMRLLAFVLRNRGTRFRRLARGIEVLDGVNRRLLQNPGRFTALVGLSVLVWILHILQLALFFPLLKHPIPLGPALTLLPLAVLVGMLPLTVGGMGTRDSAILALFASYADTTVLAAVALLCSVRHWTDTLMGVPFFYGYSSGKWNVRTASAGPTPPVAPDLADTERRPDAGSIVK